MASNRLSLERGDYVGLELLRHNRSVLRSVQQGCSCTWRQTRHGRCWYCSWSCIMLPSAGIVAPWLLLPQAACSLLLSPSFVILTKSQHITVRKISHVSEDANRPQQAFLCAYCCGREGVYELSKTRVLETTVSCCLHCFTGQRSYDLAPWKLLGYLNPLTLCNPRLVSGVAVCLMVILQGVKRSPMSC